MSLELFWLILTAALGVSLLALRIMASDHLKRWQQLVAAWSGLALVLFAVFLM